jgi:hypothetical protein
VPVLITALLAAVLVLYVFTGERGSAEASPHCSSEQTLALVKHEIFDRAAGLRGDLGARFTQIANYSVLRSPSTLVRRVYAGRGEVDCSGTLVLDLPPGFTVSDGRHSLAAQINYRLKHAPGGITQLDGVTNAEAIASALAGVAQPTKPAPPGSLPPLAPPKAVAPTQPLPRAPAPTPPVVAAAALPPETPQPKPQAPAVLRKGLSPRTTLKPALVAKSQRPSTPEQPPTASHEPGRTMPTEIRPPPERAARSGPSFDCRSAHTRGEIIVCSNPALADLDGEMAQRFHGAMAAARPGQRQMLRRTGRRFIRYRDSCPSIACMAEAYRGRMREISIIMTGPW